MMKLMDYLFVCSCACQSAVLVIPLSLQLQPVGLRQAKLLDDYGFECDCQRCQQERVLEEKVRLLLSHRLH